MQNTPTHFRFYQNLIALYNRCLRGCCKLSICVCRIEFTVNSIQISSQKSCLVGMLMFNKPHLCVLKGSERQKIPHLVSWTGWIYHSYSFRRGKVELQSRRLHRLFYWSSTLWFWLLRWVDFYIKTLHNVLLKGNALPQRHCKEKRL